LTVKTGLSLILPAGLKIKTAILLVWRSSELIWYRDYPRATLANPVTVKSESTDLTYWATLCLLSLMKA